MKVKTPKPRILKSEADYESALEYVATLMDAKPDSPQEDQLELWALLIEQYEKQNHPIAPPDPVEAIKFRMDQLGLKQKDLATFMASKSKVSEVLNRKLPLSLPMIRALNSELDIPANVLIQPLKKAAKKNARKPTKSKA